MHAPPRPAPTPGEMAAPGRPGPENFQECPAPPHPENAPGFNCYPAPPLNFFPLPRPEAKKRLPRASLVDRNKKTQYCKLSFESFVLFDVLM